jgi:hypothetical protein
MEVDVDRAILPADLLVLRDRRALHLAATATTAIGMVEDAGARPGRLCENLDLSPRLP